MAEEEKKKLSPLAVAGGAVASVASMIIGSFFGDSGTIFGAALSSVTCSVGAFLFEDRTRRAHAKLKARRERGKPASSELQERLADLPLERSIHEMRIREHLRTDWGFAKRLAVAGGMLALCLGMAAVTLVTVEKATGKTLTSNVTGRAQYGTTLGGYSSVKPSALPSVSPGPSHESISVSPSATISAVPDASPDESPSGISPDPFPDSAPVTSPAPAGSGL